MASCREFDISYWLWTALTFGSYNPCCEMDWISSFLWSWRWCDGLRGKFLPRTEDTSPLFCLRLSKLHPVHQTYVAIQNLVPPAQIPIAMGIIIFAQNMGGAVFLVAANAIFSNSLRSQLQQRATAIKIDPDVIISAGFSSIRKLVSGAELAAVLQAYSNSVDHVMYLGIGASIATFAFSWGLGWKDIRVEKKRMALRSSGTQDRDQGPTK